MFRTLSIEGFRGFKTLHLEGLGRVNLLVGANNSGKTSVLEAVQFLAMGGDLTALMSALRRRFERSTAPSEEQPIAALDVRFLFHGRSLDGDPIRLKATTNDGRQSSYEVAAPRVSLQDDVRLEQWKGSAARIRRAVSRGGQLSLLQDDFEPGDRAPRLLEVSAGGEPIGRAPLLQGSNLVDEEMVISGARATVPVQFVGTSSLTQQQLARLLDRAVLADEEAGAIAALNTVEDGITKIAAVEQDSRGGRRIVVGLRDIAETVPLGSLGDGMSRMLALALSLVAARDGYLLIDEIDTGLHHTVMRKMWRLVFEAAKRLNVCVYATTHSYDCVHALATIADPDVRGVGEVALLRVDRGSAHAVHFSEREISLLGAREIEPR